MFAEELKGNANRKRQEQARERRRRAKQQQLKKDKEKEQQTKQPPISTEESSKKDDGGDISNIDSTVRNDDKKKLGLSGPIHSTENVQSDAVAKALEQRKIRSIQKAQNAAATVIQSTYRSFKCVCKVKETERNILEKRLGDLETLITILKKQKKTEYVPPTSLAMTFVHQILFLTHTTPRMRKMSSDREDLEKAEYKFFSRIKNLTINDVKLISKILEVVLLPGIISNDPHLDPTIVLLESSEGRMKLKKILRLASFVLVHRIGCDSKMTFAADKSHVNIIEKFVKVLMGFERCTSVNGNVVSYCKSILLSESCDYSTLTPGSVKLGSMPLSKENLDLIHLLRCFLLYPSHRTKNVIPSTAYEAREKCIQQNDRERGDVLFQLTLNAVLESKSILLRTRFFAEIFSVPLLLWKIESTTLSRLVQSNSDDSTTKCTFLALIDAFLDCSAEAIERGLFESSSIVFPTTDVPFTLCPAPSVLLIFSNCVQLGYMCPAVNGSTQFIDFEAATLYFNFMATLMDQIPLATFSSRQSSVEWIHDGTHLTPVVLPQVVLDQCKVILLDSYIRSLFHSAIDTEVLNVATIIKKKDSRDLKLEKDLEAIMTESTTSVAAKEAMINRNKGILGSKWARNLSNKISSVFSKEKKTVKKDPNSLGKGALMNTSTMSRKLADGSLNKQMETKEATIGRKDHNTKFDQNFLFALSRTYAVFLSRWGGLGGEDIVQRSQSSDESKNTRATMKQEPCVLPLLNVLAFSTQYVTTAWSLIQSNKRLSSDVNGITDVRQCAKPVRSLQILSDLKVRDVNRANTGQAILLVFIFLLSHILIVTDDIELHDEDSTPLPLHQIRRCVILLKNILYRACCIDDTGLYDSSVSPTNHFGLSLIASSSKLMRDLHDRSSRRALCAPKLWLFENLLEKDIRQCKSYDDYCNVLNSPVLRVCPFLVSFKRRLKLFEKIVTSNRESIQGRNDGFSARPGVKVNIMRGRVLEDGLIHLNKLGRDLRQRIIVQYLNQAGAKEIGLDAGGLFKEFWTDLSELSFNLNYALFRETEDGYMYPNPSSRAAHGSDSVILFEFLGRILGKALYEGITIKPQFAHFFLSFLRGEYNFLHMLPDLSTMDKTLYNNLMFLKTYDGSAEDLCLSFTIANDDFGTNKEIELIPNGANIDVTDFNKHRYIGLVAKHHVCDRVKEQSQAFTRGLWDVIDRNWLRIFNEPELQVLISGPSDGKIDVEDMKANSQYTGGYTIFDRNIHRFWNIVSSLSQKQQADLLRFVTSCERPPPLGFGSLNPPFTIQRVGIMTDSDKLPTASTCFNVLKLPTYSSEKVMRERLIYAIESGAGFELT